MIIIVRWEAPTNKGVQKDPKPKIRTENSIPEPNFRVPKSKYLTFSVRVPELILLSSYRFGYGSSSLPKRVPDNPIFLNFLIFLKLLNQWPNAPISSGLRSGLRALHTSPTVSTDQL